MRFNNRKHAEPQLSLTSLDPKQAVSEGDMGPANGAGCKPNTAYNQGIKRLQMEPSLWPHIPRCTTIHCLSSSNRSERLGQLCRSHIVNLTASNPYLKHQNKSTKKAKSLMLWLKCTHCELSSHTQLWHTRRDLNLGPDKLTVIGAQWGGCICTGITDLNTSLTPEDINVSFTTTDIAVQMLTGAWNIGTVSGLLWGCRHPVKATETKLGRRT